MAAYLAETLGLPAAQSALDQLPSTDPSLANQDLPFGEIVRASGVLASLRETPLAHKGVIALHGGRHRIKHSKHGQRQKVGTYSNRLRRHAYAKAKRYDGRRCASNVLGEGR